MVRVVIVGCGVVGAAIAYELSRDRRFRVAVFDRQPPAREATAAALGILIGIASRKTKGRLWRLREDGVRRYPSLVAELETIAGDRIPYNREGLLFLCYCDEDLAEWARLVEVRRQQGWPLEILDAKAARDRYPQLGESNLVAAVRSPQDAQVDPVALTHALVAGAIANGTTFHFDAAVEGFSEKRDRLLTAAGETIEADFFVLSAGLGTTPLAASLQLPAPEMRPVLGQALHLRLEAPLGDRQPAITGDDTHIAPLISDKSPAREYWVGATVEFPDDRGVPLPPDLEGLERVHQRAIAICPALGAGTVLHSWSGLRPRPQGRSAPIIEWLPGCDRVLLAAGHYRNGILLAPGTAIAVRKMLEEAIARTSTGNDRP